jgi:hypothetical protein
VKPSRWQIFFFCIAYVVLSASVIAWQPNIVHYQLLLQLLFWMAVSVYCVKKWRKVDRSAWVVQVSYQGEWNYLDGREEANWWIGEDSKMLDGLLWVQLIPLLQRTQSKASSVRWCWIFKDSVSERDYRRLCRCILASQQRSSLPQT